MTLTFLHTKALVLLFMTMSASHVFAEASSPNGMDILKPLVGKWQYEMHLANNDQIAPSARGVTNVSLILGGRFIEIQSMSTEGPSIEAMGLLGFDNRTERNDYFLLSLDELSSHYVTSRGMYHPDRNAIVLLGSETDTKTKLEYKFETVLAFQGLNRFQTEYFSINADGVRNEVARIAYRRVNSEAMLVLATSEEIHAMTFDVLQAELSRVSKLRSRAGLNDRDREVVRQVFIDLLRQYARIARSQSQEENEEFMRSQDHAEVIQEIRSLIRAHDGSSHGIRDEMLKSLEGLSR